MSALTRTKRKRPDQITTSTTVLTLQHTVTTRTPLKSIENLPRPIEKRKRNVEQVGRWTRKKLKEANAGKKATQEAVQKKERLRNALFAVYVGRLTVKDAYRSISHFQDHFAADCLTEQIFTSLVSSLPVGLVENNEFMQVTRATNALSGYAPKKPFTNHEARLALIEHVCNKATQNDLERKYGIPARTLREYLKPIKDRLNWNSKPR